MTKRIGFVVGFVVALGGGASLAAAPALFGKLQPGMWEFSGVDGSRTPIRLCLGDLRELARVQHLGRRCSQTVIADRPTATTINYQCSASEFGHSRLSLVTTRNVRVETQGIAGGLPFSYVAQARRVGDCNFQTPAGR